MGLAPTILGANEGTLIAADVESGRIELETERVLFEEIIETIELNLKENNNHA